MTPARIRAGLAGRTSDPAQKANPVPKTEIKPNMKTEEKGDPPIEQWQKAAKKLEPYERLYERWRGKMITNEEYAKARGCFSPCDLKHADHFPLTDGLPPLLVSYLGEWGVTHRRHDGSREMPSYIFGPSAIPVRITDPFDKFAYINRHITNPEVWAIKFDGVHNGGKA